MGFFSNLGGVIGGIAGTAIPIPGVGSAIGGYLGSQLGGLADGSGSQPGQSKQGAGQLPANLLSQIGLLNPDPAGTIAARIQQLQNPNQELSSFQAIARSSGPGAQDLLRAAHAQGRGSIFGQRLYEDSQNQASLQGLNSFRQFRTGLEGQINDLTQAQVGNRSTAIDQLLQSYYVNQARKDQSTRNTQNLIAGGLGQILGGPLGEKIFDSILGKSQTSPSVGTQVPDYSGNIG